MAQEVRSYSLTLVGAGEDHVVCFISLLLELRIYS